MGDLPPLVSRRAEARRNPRPLPVERVDEVVLGTAAAAMLLLPVAGPFALLLAPVAWFLGARRQRTLARALRQPSEVAEMGRKLGRLITMVFGTLLAVAGVLLFAVWLGRRG